MSNSVSSPEVRETGESDSSVWDFLVKKIVSERLDTAESLLSLFNDMQAALLELKKLAERSLTCEKPEEESVSVSLSPIMSSVLGMSQVGGVTRYILPQSQIPEQYHQLLGFPTGTPGGREVDVLSVDGDGDGDVQLMKSMEKEDENTHPDKAENDSKSVEKDTEERSKSKEAELKKPKDDKVTVKRKYRSTKNDSFDSDHEDRKGFGSRSRDRYRRRRRSRSRDRDRRRSRSREEREWRRREEREREERPRRQREREVTVPVSNPSLRPSQSHYSVPSVRSESLAGPVSVAPQRNYGASQFVPRSGQCSLDTARSSHPPPPPPERPGVVVRPDAMELEEISSGKLYRLQCTVYRRPLI